MKRPRSGVASAAKVKAEVKEEEAIVPMDPALLADLPPMSTGILLPQTGDVDGNVVHPPFELDENTMRTLQQFMDSHGFHTSPNHSADEQSPIVPGTVPQTNSTSTLAQELARHFLPSRIDVKPETEEERQVRGERIKQENRERKKRWREQNRDRNKDNDLRCRVNKRANLIFGVHASTEKQRYIEDEFRKRQFKRHGKDSSPAPEAPQPWYTPLVHDPEFAQVILQLLVAKGLDPDDPDTTQMVELLQRDPKSIEKFGLTFIPQQPVEEMEEQFDPEMPQTLPQETTIFEGFEATQLPLVNHVEPHEHIPMAPSDQTFVINETAILSQPVSTPAPIPKLDVKVEDVESTPVAPRQPPRRTAIAPPPYIPPAIPTQTRTLASKDRIRAMGFPPAISPPPR